MILPEAQKQTLREIAIHVRQRAIVYDTWGTDFEIEVMVIYQILEPSAPAKTPEELGWPPGFFEQTAGSLQDDPIVRYPQGEYEQRESLE